MTSNILFNLIVTVKVWIVIWNSGTFDTLSRLPKSYTSDARQNGCIYRSLHFPSRFASWKTFLDMNSSSVLHAL